MKDLWRTRYRESIELLGGNQVSTLTGFNANIDIHHDLEDLNLDLSGIEGKIVNPVEDMEDLRSSLKYCVEHGVNKEVNRKNFDQDLSFDGSESLGGQGGIIANFLSGIGEYAVFYTPLLSQDLVDKLNDEVVYPVIDGKFLLKRVGECVNTDRTKYNTIIEFEEDETGRLIISGSVKGFGPYFRKGVEENIEGLDSELDRVILSGFQNIDGNFDTKIDKASMQLQKFETPKHLEYVSTDSEKTEKILDDLLPAFESIGMDEIEAKELAEHIGIDVKSELSLGEAFKIAENLVEEKNLSRCHIHSYRFQLIVTDENYPVRKSAIRKGLLFGVASSLRLAEIGEIPDRSELEKFNLENKHIHRLDQLEDFENHLDLENFAETGLAEIDNLNVVAAPTLIHEDPERLVGMGDVISSGSFIGEIK